MANEQAASGAEVSSSATTLDGGNYDVIRGRLLEHGSELGRRADALNGRRKETFGGQELAVIATERVRTEHNCLPVDIVEVGGRLLVGFNVFIGLKSETKIADVFALHRFDVREGGYDCSAVGFEDVGGFLQDPQFVKDFTALYKYVRDAQLLQLVSTDTRLFAIFQVGASWRETTVFRWSIEPNGAVRYTDDRGEREYQSPRQHDFEWIAPAADDQVDGRFVDIAGKVFVSCIGGRLRLSVEDNSKEGLTVLTEPVDDRNQALSDANIRFAEFGHLVVLEIQPFREEKKRHFVFNAKTRAAVRIDAIAQSCVALPEDHGLVFPGGVYLESGDHKLFDGDHGDLEFHRKLASPNGEDVLFLFYEQRRGTYALFPYNLIRKEVATPIRCGGYSLFDDGRLVVFRDESEPTRVHPMQIWQTPFTSVTFAAEAPTDGSFLAKVGNAELVRGISDALSLCRLARLAQPTRQTFEDLIAGANRMVDAFYWLEREEAFNLKAVVAQLRATTETIIDEFEKVVAFRREAERALADAEEKFAVVGRELRPEHWRKVDPFLEGLANLRKLRGHLIGLRELRSMDLAKVAELETRVTGSFDELSKACVFFLSRGEALAPLTVDLDALARAMPAIVKASDVRPHKEKLALVAEGLALLGEVVSNLPIEDATQRTKILEGLSAVFGQLNRTRAIVEGRRKELASAEGRAEVVVQVAVLGQAVSSAIGLADSPAKCDEQLSRLLVQLEELEGRFSDIEELSAELAGKRDEIYEAFGAKKQQLLDEKARRVASLATAAERILDGIARRGRSQKTVDDLNAYFAADAMVLKLRQLAAELQALGDSVKSEAVLSKLKAARQEALRGLRDKLDLYEGDGEFIKLGRHRFTVNTQPLELTMVPKSDGTSAGGQPGTALAFHLTGTDYYEPVADAAFEATRRFWDQSLPSETPSIYRSEFLAFLVFTAAVRGQEGASLAALREAQRAGKLDAVVGAFAAERHDEGYDRGVHDQDAAKILERLLILNDSAGLLRFSPKARALGQLFWGALEDSETKRAWSLQAKSLGRLRSALGLGDALTALAAEAAPVLGAFAAKHGLEVLVPAAVEAGSYLIEELTGESFFTVSAESESLRDGLVRQLELQGTRSAFDEDMRALDGHVRERFGLAVAWVDAFIAADPARETRRRVAVEAAVMLCSPGLSRVASAALCEGEVVGLIGQHPRVVGGAMRIGIDEVLARVGHYLRDELPAYRGYRKLRAELIDRERTALRLAEYRPQVMSAFVRNRLINDVYLPLVGDNLAKQIGAAGDGKRTDLMGLLLLVSPPGYGKTTLMEYVASRLGLVFVKVNGPALGHGVVSIDPAEAPNATARQEVEKVNLAFEMGNNVMLYLDDIQHTNPEFLQKFISLCDAQRRVEGVWRGRTRTYDFRGRKFCVVMAGNPYTESGEAFKIPDMLANRADTYNLGDVLSGKEDVFASSYLENALTSNSALQPLATRDTGDVEKLIRLSCGEPIASTDLRHGYSAAELAEITAVFKHLGRVQRSLLLVNLQYIASAAQDDRFRNEPPFKLQGSYRNMNKLAEKVVSAMTDDEIEQLVTSHYTSEAQTLTTGAEANLLKLGELRGRASTAETSRWQEIKREYVRHKRMGGAADDPVARLSGTIAGVGADLQAIRAVLDQDRTTAVATELALIRAELGDDNRSELVAAVNSLRDVVQQGGERGIEEAIDGLRLDVRAVREVMLKRPTMAPPPEAEPSADEDGGDAPRLHRARSLAGAEGWLTPYLLRIEAALEAVGQAPVAVHAAMPREIADLIREQNRLVEQALLPLAQAAASRSEESELALSAVRSLLEKGRRPPPRKPPAI